jgi:hypothetical protein
MRNFAADPHQPARVATSEIIVALQLTSQDGSTSSVSYQHTVVVAELFYNAYIAFFCIG